MANEIQDKLASPANFTLTLASLASGAARQSTLVSNSGKQPRALVFIQIESGAAAPAAGKLYEVYLIRSNGTIADDNAGASDAAITIENAKLLDTLVVTNTANKKFYAVMDTAPLGPLGASWGIAVKNATDQSLNGTEGNHGYSYTYDIPEIQ